MKKIINFLCSFSFSLFIFYLFCYAAEREIVGLESDEWTASLFTPAPRVNFFAQQIEEVPTCSTSSHSFREAPVVHHSIPFPPFADKKNNNDNLVSTVQQISISDLSPHEQITTATIHEQIHSNRVSSDSADIAFLPDTPEVRRKKGTFLGKITDFFRSSKTASGEEGEESFPKRGRSVTQPPVLEGSAGSSVGANRGRARADTVFTAPENVSLSPMSISGATKEITTPLQDIASPLQSSGSVPMLTSTPSTPSTPTPPKAVTPTLQRRSSQTSGSSGNRMTRHGGTSLSHSQSVHSSPAGERASVARHHPHYHLTADRGHYASSHPARQYHRLRHSEQEPHESEVLDHIVYTLEELAMRIHAIRDVSERSREDSSESTVQSAVPSADPDRQSLSGVDINAGGRNTPTLPEEKKHYLLRETKSLYPDEEMFALGIGIHGGGIRGILPALFLKRFQDEYKIDLMHTALVIGGTSSGAITTLASLALDEQHSEKYRYTRDNVVEFYITRGQDIFERSKTRKLTSFQGASKSIYSRKPIDAVLKADLGESFFGDLYQKKGHYVGVVSVKASTITPKIWESDIAFRDASEDAPLWQIAAASSAAPVYWGPASVVTRAGNLGSYVDGGIALNNPTPWVASKLTNLGFRRENQLLLSLGTGIVDDYYPDDAFKDAGLMGWGVKNLFSKVIKQNSIVHDAILSNEFKDRFFSIQSDLHVKKDKLDDVSTENIAYLTSRSLKSIEEQAEMLLKLARIIEDKRENGLLYLPKPPSTPSKQ